MPRENVRVIDVLVVGVYYSTNTVAISDGRLESALIQESDPDLCSNDTDDLTNDPSNLELKSEARSPPEIQDTAASINVEPDINTDIPSLEFPTQFNLPSNKPLLTTEQVGAFYQADLFVPGFFDSIFFLVLGLMVPFMDYATDYYYAGPDSNIQFKCKVQLQ